MSSANINYFLTEGGNAVVMQESNVDLFPESVRTHYYAIKTELSNFTRSTYAIAYHMGQLKKDDNFRKMGFKTIKEMSEKLFKISTSTLYGFADVGLKYIVCETVEGNEDVREYHTIFQKRIKKFDPETGEPYYVISDIPISNIKEIASIPTNFLKRCFDSEILRPDYKQSFFKEFTKLYKEMVSEDGEIDFDSFAGYVHELAITNDMTAKKLIEKYTVKAIINDNHSPEKSTPKKSTKNASGDEIEMSTKNASGDEIEMSTNTPVFPDMSSDYHVRPEKGFERPNNYELSEMNFPEKWSEITRSFDKFVEFAKANPDFYETVTDYLEMCCDTLRG